MIPCKVIVTGGGGFLGKALCKRLVAQGHQTHSVSRKVYTEHSALGVKSHALDLGLASVDELTRVFEGAQVVFHAAAKVNMWGNYADFFNANVRATESVIQACRRARVGNLVFTSSPSVVACEQDLRGIDESFPYPAKFEAFYPQTKAQAEKLIVAASGAELRTVALRPKLIFGPDDTNLIPSILKKARSGKLKRIGSGENYTDLSFVDDCVEAHLLAWQGLENNPALGGRIYFISQGEAVNMWRWIDEVLQRSGLPPIDKQVSERLARTAAGVAEFICKHLLPGKEPFLTRFLVSEMCRDHYFDISAARRDFGYVPRYSIKEALDLTFPPGTALAAGWR